MKLTLKPVTWQQQQYGAWHAMIDGVHVGTVAWALTGGGYTARCSFMFQPKQKLFDTVHEAKVAVEACMLYNVKRLAEIAE